MEKNWSILDFAKFTNGMITGLSLEEINSVMNENVNENELSFIDDLFNIDTEPFDLAEIPEDVINELNSTELEIKPKSSKDQEKQHVTKFCNFLREKKIICDLAHVTEANLNQYLRWFYHELRTNTGNYYSPASLRCIRIALHRFLTQIWAALLT